MFHKDGYGFRQSDPDDRATGARIDIDAKSDAGAVAGCSHSECLHKSDQAQNVPGIYGDQIRWLSYRL